MVDIYEPGRSHDYNENPYQYYGNRAWIQTKRGYIMHKLRQFSSTPSAHFLWSSTRSFDSFFIAAAAQIGQAIILLPQTLAYMGYGWGVVFMILYAAFGSWSVFILTWLYMEFRIRNEREARDLGMGRILQYHEIIGGVAGRPMGNFTLVFNVITLLMFGVVTLISSASNLHLLNSNILKRNWQILVGILSLLSVLMPGFKHFRLAAIIGLISTTIVAVYLTVAARENGQDIGVTHRGPKSSVDFFFAATTILFVFGGHGITIEILEAMEYPEKFGFVYPIAVLYILILCIASSTSVYWAYGDDLMFDSNAFAVLPSSPMKKFAIFCLFVHQSFAFIMYMYPVFLVFEKLFRVHTRRFAHRVLARIPVVLFVWFIALAVPFFGAISAVVGSLFISMSVYFIPLLAFYLAYRDKEAQKMSVFQFPSHGFARGSHTAPNPHYPNSSSNPHYPIWQFIFIINLIIMLWIIVIGLLVGAWATTTKFVRDVNTYSFFAKCYQCNL